MRIRVRDVSDFLFCHIKPLISLKFNISPPKSSAMILGSFFHNVYLHGLKYGKRSLFTYSSSLIKKLPEKLKNQAASGIDIISKNLLHLPTAFIEQTLFSSKYLIRGKPDAFTTDEKPVIIELKFMTKNIEKPPIHYVVQIIWYFLLFKETFPTANDPTLLLLYPLQNKSFEVHIDENLINLAIKTKEHLIKCLINEEPIQNFDFSEKCTFCDYYTICHKLINV